jgi:hypothetical protein
MKEFPASEDEAAGSMVLGVAKGGGFQTGEARVVIEWNVNDRRRMRVRDSIDGDEVRYQADGVTRRGEKIQSGGRIGDADGKWKIAFVGGTREGRLAEQYRRVYTAEIQPHTSRFLYCQLVAPFSNCNKSFGYKHVLGLIEKYYLTDSIEGSPCPNENVTDLRPTKSGWRLSYRV